MDERTLKLECVKLAVALSSPTVADRVESVVRIATQLYNHINTSPSTDKLPGVDLPVPRAKRAGGKDPS